MNLCAMVGRGPAARQAQTRNKIAAFSMPCATLGVQMRPVLWARRRFRLVMASRVTEGQNDVSSP